MKIKLDENLPHQLAILLKNLGHDAHTTLEENLIGCSDDEIWIAAQRESRFFITQDLDFSDIRRFRPGSHCGLMLIRLRFPARQDLINRVLGIFQQEQVDKWTDCFVVVTEQKLRVLSPG